MEIIGYLEFCSDEYTDTIFDKIKQGQKSICDIFMQYVPTTYNPHQFTQKYAIYCGLFDIKNIGYINHNKLLKFCDQNIIVSDQDTPELAKVFAYDTNIYVVPLITLRSEDKEFITYISTMIDVYSTYLLREWWRSYAATFRKMGYPHNVIQNICLCVHKN